MKTKTIQIEVCEDCCNDCQYFTEKTIDHNYYGEKSVTPFCTLFVCDLDGTTPCEECKKKTAITEHELEKYVKYLVEKIEQLHATTKPQAVQEYKEELQKIFCKGKLYEPLRVMLFNALEAAERKVLRDYLK